MKETKLDYLQIESLREQFAHFFERGDSFTLGVCNGCQMVSNLKELIPGADHWPHFVRNRSEQFEARLALVRGGGAINLLAYVTNSF